MAGYCSNCGRIVASKGTCPYCGAILKDEVQGGSSAHQNMTSYRHDLADRMYKDREAERVADIRRTGLREKYGYVPIVSFPIVAAAALLGVIGLVLSYVISPKFLILFGLANILTLALYWLHLQNDDVHNRQSSQTILAEPLNIESKLLSILFTAYLFLGFFLVRLSEFVSVVCAIAGLILVLALYFLCKQTVA